MDDNNQAKHIGVSQITETNVAVRQFEDLGGRLTTFSSFGEDPLKGNAHLLDERVARFQQRYPNFNNFFHSVVNGNYSLFRDGVLFLISISRQLQRLI